MVVTIYGTDFFLLSISRHLRYTVFCKCFWQQTSDTDGHVEMKMLCFLCSTKSLQANQFFFFKHRHQLQLTPSSPSTSRFSYSFADL